MSQSDSPRLGQSGDWLRGLLDGIEQRLERQIEFPRRATPNVRSHICVPFAYLRHICVPFAYLRDLHDRLDRIAGSR